MKFQSFKPVKLYSNKKTNVEIDEISTIYTGIFPSLHGDEKDFSFLPAQVDLSLLNKVNKDLFLYEKSHFILSNNFFSFGINSSMNKIQKLNSNQFFIFSYYTFEGKSNKNKNLKFHFFYTKFIDKKTYKQILKNSNQNSSSKFWVVLNSKKKLLNTFENLKCLNPNLFFNQHFDEKQKNLVKINQKLILNFNSNLWSIIEFLNDSSYNSLFFYPKSYLRSCFSTQVNPLINYSLFLSNFILIFYTICNISSSFRQFPKFFREANNNLSHVKKEFHLYGKLKAIFSLFLSFPFLRQPENINFDQNQNNEKSIKVKKFSNLKEELTSLSSLNLILKNQRKSANFSTYIEEILALSQKQKLEGSIQFEDYFKLKQYFKKTLFQFYFNPLALTQFSIKNSFFHQNQRSYFSIDDSIEYLRIANENYFTCSLESFMNQGRTENSVRSCHFLPYVIKDKGKRFSPHTHLWGEFPAYEIKTNRESMVWYENNEHKCASFIESLGVGHFVLRMEINSSLSHFFHLKNQNKISPTKMTFPNFSSNILRFPISDRKPFNLEANLYEKKRNKGTIHLFLEKNRKLPLSFQAYDVIKILPHTGTGSFDVLSKEKGDKKLLFSMQKMNFFSALISKIEQYTFSFFSSNRIFQLVFDFLQKNQDFETFQITLLTLFEKQNSNIFQTLNSTSKILTTHFLKNHFFFLFQKSYTYKNFRLSKKFIYSSFSLYGKLSSSSYPYSEPELKSTSFSTFKTQEIKIESRLTPYRTEQNISFPFFLEEKTAANKNKCKIDEKNKKLALRDINEKILFNDSFLQEKIIKMHDRTLKLKAWQEKYKNQFFLLNNHFFYFTKKSFELAKFLKNIQFLCRKFHFKMFQSHVFHSCFKLLNQKPGFEFEGFHFIQVNQKQNEFIKIQNQLLPSSQRFIIYLKELKKIVEASKVQSQQILIQRLRNSILEWCESNKIISNKKSFYLCDYLLFKWIWKWACRRHSNKSRQWIQKKYYHLFEIFPKESLATISHFGSASNSEIKFISKKVSELRVNTTKTRKKWNFCFYNPNLKSFECLSQHSKTNLVKYQKIPSNFFIYNQNWKYLALYFLRKKKKFA